MKQQVFLSFFALFTFMIIGASGEVVPTQAATVNHKIWGELLRKNSKQSGVDYAGFKSEEDRLDQYLKVLENTDSKDLSENEQFAFYINAYNAWTIKLILSAYPGIKSIKELGSLLKSPWEREIVRIDGRLTTLDEIEHHILRPRFKDPRVHFAINCSAVSCPPLSSEPYLGSTLDRQLDHSTRSFINDPGSYRFDGDTLYVSRIFKWFPEDFNDDIFGFFLEYAEGNLKKKLVEKKDTIRLKYLQYNWSLNDVGSLK
jgi:Protein of unknown function, DUF547